MPVRWAGSALSFGSVMTASMRPWDPPTQVKSESTSVAANHRWSAGHRRCGAGSSSSLDEPVMGSVAPQWPTSSRWPRKSMYSRLGIRTFGPARTLAGNHGEMPRAGSPCIPEAAPTHSPWKQPPGVFVRPARGRKNRSGPAPSSPARRKAHRAARTSPRATSRARNAAPRQRIRLASTGRQIIPVAVHGRGTGITRPLAF